MKITKKSEITKELILIAEDSPTQAEQLKHILEESNYKVLVAEDGKVALNLIHKNKPDLIISDIVMPVMNGYEFCKAVKADSSTFDIPVILLTSLSSSDDVLEGLACGANNFLTKPYSKDYLLSHIENILANKKIGKVEQVKIGVEIISGGEKKIITAGHQQLLSLLISTYEAAISKNAELVLAQEELLTTNEHLEELVIERTLELTNEIADRKRAEEQISKLNRVYAVLSNINQAIVRIHNVDHILNDACLIAIDEGKFQRAWIGLIDFDTKKILASSFAGVTNDYFNKLSNDFSTSIPEDNPIKNVIRFGQHIVSNDIINDKILSDELKQNSKSFGLKSFAVFPLKVFGKSVGAFILYSDEINFFDEKEISLLDEMAQDISFAIEYIQTESERNKAKETLMASELRYRRLFESAKDGILILNAETGMITDVNPFLIDLLGYSRENFLSKEVWEVGFLNDIISNIDNFNELIEKDYIRYEDKPLKTSDGRQIDVEFISNVYSVDNIKVVQCNIRDITERKQAELALIKLRKAVDASGEAIFLTDKEGIFTYVNPGFTTLYGYTPDEVVGNFTPRILKSGQIELQIYEKFWDTLLSGKEVRGELINRRKDGTLLEIESSSSPIFDEIKNIIGFLGIQRDITERKLSEQNLLKAKKQAEELSRLKTSFLANMSHELRTPLNGLLGFSEILVEEIKDPIQNEMIGLVFESAARLKKTVNKILDFTRIESNKQEISLSEIDIIDFISGIAEHHKTNASNKKLDFNINIKNKNMSVTADENLLFVSLENIIDNAIKFTEKGGITIEIDKFIDKGTPYCSIKISDTGIGIPEDKLSVIFEEFRQISEGLNRSFEGTGLGLTISKKYLTIMNGKIYVESKLNKGTIFTILLPITATYIERNVIEKKPQEIVSKKIELLNKKLILLVEDDKISQDFVKYILKNIYQIDLTDNATDAVAMAKGKEYSAILMDINLGVGKSGLDAAQEIKRLPKYQNIPIVALTAFAMKNDKEEFLNKGCTHYLSKPFTKEELKNLMIELLKN